MTTTKITVELTKAMEQSTSTSSSINPVFIENIVSRLKQVNYSDDCKGKKIDLMKPCTLNYIQPHIIKVDVTKLPHNNLVIDDKVVFTCVGEIEIFYDLCSLQAYPRLTMVYFTEEFNIIDDIITSYDDKIVFPNVTAIAVNYACNRFHDYLDIDKVFPNATIFMIDMVVFNDYSSIRIKSSISNLIHRCKYPTLLLTFNNKNSRLVRKTVLKDLSKNLKTNPIIKTVILYGLFDLNDISTNGIVEKRKKCIDRSSSSEESDSDGEYYRKRYTVRTNLPNPNIESKQEELIFTLQELAEQQYEKTKTEYFVLKNLTFTYPIDLHFYNVKLRIKDNCRGIASVHFNNSILCGKNFDSIEGIGTIKIASPKVIKSLASTQEWFNKHKYNIGNRAMKPAMPKAACKKGVKARPYYCDSD